MTAQPIHTIEVDHETDEDGTTVSSIRFFCHAPPGVACKRYPSCDCEYWSEEHELDEDTDEVTPGHEYVAQVHCWMLPWFQNMDLMDIVEYARLKGAAEDGGDLEGYSYQDLIVSGPVQLEWAYEDETYIEIGGEVDSLCACGQPIPPKSPSGKQETLTLPDLCLGCSARQVQESKGVGTGLRTMLERIKRTPATG